jgi:hypothetical protein
MNKFKTLTLGALGLMAFACNVEVGDAVEETGSTEEATTCSNQEGVNAAIAAMAVETANEIKRWLPMRDFECQGPWVGQDMHSNWQNTNNTPDGLVDEPGSCIRYSSTWRLDTSPKADPRCPNRVCGKVLTLFRLQDSGAEGLIIAGTPLVVGALRSRMEAYWGRQALCQQNGAGNCVAPVYKWDSTSHMPVEYHELDFINATPGTCGKDFNFHGCKQNTGQRFGNTCQTLSKPGSLVNNLMWAGADSNGTLNPYLAFYGDASYVKIDPAGGMVYGDDTMVGGAYQGCTTTTASIAGANCSCLKSDGSVINGTFKPSGVPGIWKCKL